MKIKFNQSGTVSITGLTYKQYNLLQALVLIARRYACEAERSNPDGNGKNYVNLSEFGSFTLYKDELATLKEIKI